MSNLSILFVDDEPNTLEGLKRTFRPMRHQWDMHFVESGKDALGVLQQKPFDAVVSDMRMPNMNGAELLRIISNTHPETVRIILSGQADQEDILKTIGPSHQYLSKPCDTDSLKLILDRAFKLRDYLADENLRRLTSQVRQLPSAPRLFMELMDAIKDPDVSIHTIGKIISKDIGMMLKILKVVNSAYFGISRKINTAAEAVSYLGLDIIKSLVLSVQLFSQFDQKKAHGLSFDAVFSHSLKTAHFAKLIVEAESNDKLLAGSAFIAGMIHDAGKLVLAEHLPEKYSEVMRDVQQSGRDIWLAEKEVFGADHGHVGAYLIGLWGFPNHIVEALAFHHEPSKCFHGTFGPLTAVYVASAISYCKDELEAQECAKGLNLDYLRSTGKQDRLEKWIELCMNANAEEIES